MHIVSAWASEEGSAWGQVATEEKSDEITAIAELLKPIDLTDTIDAIAVKTTAAAANELWATIEVGSDASR